MNIWLLLIDLLLTAPLSFIMINLNQGRKYLINNILFPTIYILIISAIFPTLKLNIFLIPIFELFIRNFYITNIKDEYIDNKKILLCNILSIILSTVTYNIFISKVDSVLPTPEEIRSLIWVLIIIFIYNLLTEKNIKNDNFNNSNLANKKEYIRMQYAKYKTKYNNIVNSKNEEANILLYSIMIFENYQKPSIYRTVNSYLNHLLNKKTYYGIMQVPSPLPISDEESIKIVLKDIEKVFKKDNSSTESIEKYLSSFNDIKKNNVLIIYNEIKEFIKS